MQNKKENYKIFIFNSSKKKKLPIKKVSELINGVLIGENILSSEINVIYVDKDEILRLNVEYLNHNYYTDVITFSLLEEENRIEGEIYICVDVAEEQAEEYKVSLSNELSRLAIHGTLHLCGYDDKEEIGKKEMTNLENFYLGIQ